MPRSSVFASSPPAEELSWTLIVVARTCAHWIECLQVYRASVIRDKQAPRTRVNPPDHTLQKRKFQDTLHPPNQGEVVVKKKENNKKGNQGAPKFRSSLKTLQDHPREVTTLPLLCKIRRSPVLLALKCPRYSAPHSEFSAQLPRSAALLQSFSTLWSHSVSACYVRALPKLLL